jgi:nitroreductase
MPSVMIMNFDDIIKSRRSIRRFSQDPIGEKTLLELVDCGRLAPSGGNQQPLEYIIVFEREQCEKIFECTNWAAYIAPTGTPPEGYRPMAYIAIVVNTDIKESKYEYDIGAAVENILISAGSKGIGTCWIRNLNFKQIKKVLALPENILMDTVIALGYPAEESRIEPVSDSIKYWKDQDGTMHVPKRDLGSILHKNQYRQND